jgi:hypothetical protein
MHVKHCVVGALRFLRVLPHISVEAYWAVKQDGNRVCLGDPEVSQWFRSIDDARSFADSLVADSPVGPTFALAAQVDGFDTNGYSAEVVYEACAPNFVADWRDNGLYMRATA